jgi:FkbM family methyltransferase
MKTENPEVVKSIRRRTKIIVPTNDYIGRAIYFFGDLDPKVTWVCAQILRPGDVVLDIGANIGLISLTAAAIVGESGTVHSFEPQPDLADLIRRSARANGFDHLHVHCLALGSRDGAFELFVPDSNAGSASIVRRGHSGPGRSIPVHVSHAGQYLEGLNLPQIRLIKLDVEGYEQFIVKSSRDFLRRNEPNAILFELNDYNRSFSEQEIIREFVELGYQFLEIRRTLLNMRLFRIDMSRPAERYGNDILAVKSGPVSEDIMARVRAR